MVKTIKSPTCGSNWCQNHLFELNPLKSFLFLKKKTKLRLCPKHNKSYNSFDNVLPVLNIDGKHYTPLFILQEQKKFYKQHDETAHNNHQKLIEREQQDQSYFSIHEPKHGGEKPYCSVCEKGYSDYMEHIISHDHKKNLGSSIFTRYIKQIQQNLNKTQKQSANTKTPTNQTLNPAKSALLVQMQQQGQNTYIIRKKQASQGVFKLQRNTLDLDKLEMQHIEGNNFDTMTLKEIDQYI